MWVRVEFTTEPFVGEGGLPEHVARSVAVLADHGFDPEVGPFGTAVEGDHRRLLSALNEALSSAVDCGATRVTVQLSRVEQRAR
jgi:uncharacterized protein YqgV (UPF0045/DUF77 family)